MVEFEMIVVSPDHPAIPVPQTVRRHRRTVTVHQHLVFSHPLGVGQRSASAGEGKEQLGDDRDGGEAGASAFAHLQGGFGKDAFPEAKAAAEGIDQHLAAVGAGLIGVGHPEVQFGFSLREERHGCISPYR